MKTISRIGVWSLAKFQAILMAIFGLIFGLIAWGMTSWLGGIAQQSGQDLGFLASAGWLMIILLPILYGVMGLVIGAIGALLYNLVAKIVGGIEIELE